MRETDQQLCQEQQWEFSDPGAIYINCTLKRSPEISNTQGYGNRPEQWACGTRFDYHNPGHRV